MSGNANTVVNKKPPIIETIGAQRYCFNSGANGEYDPSSYETTIVKTETVKSATITENTESVPVYGSGKVYLTKTQLAYVDIEVEELAHDADDLARMRGDLVDDSGLIQSVTNPEKPFFAYGKVVKLSGGNFRLDWYPKCQLVENSDEAKTSEQNFEEQNKKLTIRAYAFDAEGKKVKNSVDSTSAKFPEGMTEELFFSKVIITKEDLISITPAPASL